MKNNSKLTTHHQSSGPANKPSVTMKDSFPINFSFMQLGKTFLDGINASDNDEKEVLVQTENLCSKKTAFQNQSNISSSLTPNFNSSIDPSNYSQSKLLVQKQMQKPSESPEKRRASSRSRERNDPKKQPSLHPQAQQHRYQSQTRSKSQSNQRQPKKSQFKMHKTKLCPHYPYSTCPKGNFCTFAHGEHELNNTSYFKTRICKAFMNGSCQKTSVNCSYAHGERQLRNSVRRDLNHQSERQPRQPKKEQKNRVDEMHEKHSSEYYARNINKIYEINSQPPPTGHLYQSHYPQYANYVQPQENFPVNYYPYPYPYNYQYPPNYSQTPNPSNYPNHPNTNINPPNQSNTSNFQYEAGFHYYPPPQYGVNPNIPIQYPAILPPQVERKKEEVSQEYSKSNLLPKNK